MSFFAKEESRQPPGFSAISDWLETWKDDVRSPESCAAAKASLQGLSEWDQRYAVATPGRF